MQFTDEDLDYFEPLIIEDFLNLQLSADEFEVADGLQFSGSDARHVGKKLLAQLGCGTTDEFFKLSLAHVKSGRLKRYPQISAPQSNEHKSVEAFVIACLQYQHTPGQFLGFETDR